MSRKPTQQQRRAIESLDREIFCEAGAGTGKTSVLVQRCVEAIVERGVDTSEILAITFTRRAAEELRGRLRAGLEDAAAKASDVEAAERLRRLARDTEKAWFSTIHSFCRRLLASEPIAAGIDPGFRVAEDGEADRLKRKAFGTALARLAERDRNRAAEVLSMCDKKDLRSIILEFHGAMRSRGIEHPVLPAEPKGDAKDLEQIWAFLCDLMEGFDGEYESLKRRRVSLDFEDLELRARALLQDDAVRSAYRERFSHVLVDEFQDTNRLQLDVIELICADGDGDGATRFAVGDELQSIYSFRHADIELFKAEGIRVSEAPDESAEKLPLSGNFRSHAEILAAVNCFGSKLNSPEDDEEYGNFTELEVGSETQLSTDQGEPRVEILLTAKGGPAWIDSGIPGLDPATTAHHVAEARSLAKRLAELRKSEPPDAKFVVLLRKMARVEIYRKALEDFGLDPHVIGGRNFWKGQQVSDVLAILRLVANPLDDEALLQALASPACGASPDALWALARGREDGSLFAALRWLSAGAEGGDEPEWPRLLDDTDRKALARFGEKLEHLRTKSAGLSLSELIEAACTDTGYDLATLMMLSGRERWANVRKLQRRAAEFESREGSDLRAFLDFASDEAERKKDGEAAAADEETGGVTVMTIHSAKGLEFDVVAVVGLGDPIWIDKKLPARIGFQPDSDVPRIGLKLKGVRGKAEDAFEMTELTNEEQSRNEAEERRIFHVGITRAQSRLLLSGVFSPGSENDDGTITPKKLTTTSGLADHLVVALKLDQPRESGTGALEIDAAPVLDGLPQPTEPVEVGISWNLPDGDAATRLAGLAGKDASGDAKMPEAEIIVPDAPPVSQANRFSFSSLSTFERCGYRFYAERELGLRRFEPAALTSTEEESETPSEDPTRDPTSGEILAGAESEEALHDPSKSALRYGPGNAVHRLLEWSSEHAWRQPPPIMVVEALRAESLGQDSKRIERVSKLIDNWLGSTTLDRIRESGVLAEVQLVLPVGSSMINGSIDLIVLPGSSGAVVEVIDYKTNALSGSNPEEKMQSYLTQRDIYALAVSHLAEEVKTTYVFLEDPSNPQEKTYDSAELGEARIRIEQLLARVASGEFPVTRRPHRALCFDCPAFRLCPWPREARERTGKDAEQELDLEQPTAQA